MKKMIDTKMYGLSFRNSRKPWKIFHKRREALAARLSDTQIIYKVIVREIKP